MHFIKMFIFHITYAGLQDQNMIMKNEVLLWQ